MRALFFCTQLSIICFFDPFFIQEASKKVHQYFSRGPAGLNEVIHRAIFFSETFHYFFCQFRCPVVLIFFSAGIAMTTGRSIIPEVVA